MNAEYPSFTPSELPETHLTNKKGKYTRLPKLGRAGFTAATLLSSLLYQPNHIRINNSSFPVGYDNCAQAGADQTIKYNGVPAMPHAQIYNVFLHWDWNTDPWWDFDMFTKDMAEGGAFDVLKPYGVDDASFIGSLIVPDNVEGLTPSQWKEEASKLIETYHLPSPSQQTIYNFFLPPMAKNADSTCMDGRSSFHEDKDGQIFFAVIVSNGADHRWLESIVHHEDAETITDRIFKQGWSAENGTEIGDICGKAKDYEDGKYQVAELYVDGKCVTPLFRGIAHQ